MVAPRYVAQRVGDEYVLVRVDPMAQVSRLAAGLGGLSLVSHAAWQRGWLGALGGLAGAGLLYYAFTGHNPASGFCAKAGAQHGERNDTPSFAEEPHSGDVHQVPADALEEAQMESFPASDPPALHTASKAPPKGAPVPAP